MSEQNKRLDQASELRKLVDELQHAEEELQIEKHDFIQTNNDEQGSTEETFPYGLEIIRDKQNPHNENSDMGIAGQKVDTQTESTSTKNLPYSNTEEYKFYNINKTKEGQTSSFPPRRSVHTKSKGMRFKIPIPILRLSLVIIFLFGILILLYTI